MVRPEVRALAGVSMEAWGPGIGLRHPQGDAPPPQLSFPAERGTLA